MLGRADRFSQFPVLSRRTCSSKDMDLGTSARGSGSQVFRADRGPHCEEVWENTANGANSDESPSLACSVGLRPSDPIEPAVDQELSPEETGRSATTSTVSDRRTTSRPTGAARPYQSTSRTTSSSQARQSPTAVTCPTSGRHRLRRSPADEALRLDLGPRLRLVASIGRNAPPFARKTG